MARIMTDGDAGRLSELETRTYHIDSEVSGLKAQLSSQGQQLNRIENMLMVPKPGPSYSTWAGVLISVLLGLGAMAIGISGYVDLQLSHVKDVVSVVSETTTGLADQIDHSKDDQILKAYELGLQKGDLGSQKARLDHYDMLYHSLDGRMRDVEAKAAAAVVSRKAIGDYAKDLGAKVQ